MNRIIKGKQCTILWHVDDLNMSHVDSDIVSRILSDIDAEYVNIAKITITWGKIYNYLGMTIDYSSTGKVKFSTCNYIINILDYIP